MARRIQQIQKILFPVLWSWLFLTHLCQGHVLVLVVLVEWLMSSFSNGDVDVEVDVDIGRVKYPFVYSVLLNMAFS